MTDDEMTMGEMTGQISVAGKTAVDNRWSFLAQTCTRHAGRTNGIQPNWVLLQAPRLAHCDFAAAEGLEAVEVIDYAERVAVVETTAIGWLLLQDRQVLATSVHGGMLQVA